jgi:CRISPR-associated protein Cmr4
MKTALLFVHALSPLHAGTGQGVGTIDLPTAREKATGIPYLPGSSLKGTLRDLCHNDSDRHAIFGPETEQAGERAGAAQFGDARLLLLPVRSLAGTYAWVTSPHLLGRFMRDAEDASIRGLPSAVPEPANDACIVTQGTALAVTHNNTNKVFLEDLDLSTSDGQPAVAWANWLGEALFRGDAHLQNLLVRRFCVVHDDVMSFLLDTALEVVTRVSLKDETKTVGEGPWFEESLPAETVLYGLLVCGPELKPKSGASHTGMDARQVMMKVADLAAHRPMQLGGKATVGRGLCRVTLVEGAS